MVGWHAAARWTRQLWPALVGSILVLTLGVAGSAMLARQWTRANHKTVVDTVSRRISTRTGLLASAANKVDALLTAQAAYVRAVSDARGLPRHEQFASYLTALGIEHKPAVLRSAGWVVPVAGARLPTVLAALRADGRPGLAVHPAFPHGASPNATHYLVTDQEPAATFAGTWGADLRAYPGAVATLERARDSGEPATAMDTGAGSLVAALRPTGDSPPGEDPAGDDAAATVGLVMPVYRTGAPTGTVPQRRAGLLGWVVGQLRLAAFLSTTLRGLTGTTKVPDTVYVELYSPGGTEPVASYPREHGNAARYPQSSVVRLGGVDWPLRFGPTPQGNPLAAQSATPAQGLLAGICLSVLIAVLIVLLGAQTQTKRALVRSSRRNSDLVGVLTHDARQPLATIIGFSTLILDDWAAMPDDQKRRDMTRVLDSAQHLSRLVDDMLSLARLDLAAAASHPRPVAVAPVIRGVATDLADRLADLDLSEVDTAYAWVDPTHLRQMLTNLMSNGLKYGLAPVIVSTRLRGDEIVIEVRDQGEGVPEAFVGQLFDRFTRADTGVASTMAGTGFGLYVVRTLAETNGGTIEYRPNIPNGACFVLRLRAAPVPVPAVVPA